MDGFVIAHPANELSGSPAETDLQATPSAVACQSAMTDGSLAAAKAVWMVSVA